MWAPAATGVGQRGSAGASAAAAGTIHCWPAPPPPPAQAMATESTSKIAAVGLVVYLERWKMYFSKMVKVKSLVSKLKMITSSRYPKLNSYIFDLQGI